MRVILVGCFHEMIQLCEECGFSVIGVIDFNPHCLESLRCPNDILYLGTDEDAYDIYEKYSNIPVVITPDTPFIRKKLFDKYKSVGFSFQTLIAPTAHISKNVNLGMGVVISHGVNVSSNSYISDFVKVNVNANIMHDCFVGNFTTIAPNAVLLGNVRVGDLSYVGANATILPYHNIANNTVIGAASVVTKDFTISGTYYGNPAKLASNDSKD